MPSPLTLDNQQYRRRNIKISALASNKAKLQLRIKRTKPQQNIKLNVKFHGYLLSSFTNCEQIIPFVSGAKHVTVGHTRGSGYLLL